MAKELNTDFYNRNVDMLNKHGYDVRPIIDDQRKGHYLSVDVYNMYEDKFLGNFPSIKYAVNYFRKIIHC